MSDFNQKELLTFLSLFNDNTKNLTEPMFTWFGDGAYTVEEAISKIKEGFIPEEWIGICAKRPDDYYWDTVEISKNEDNSYTVGFTEMGAPFPDFIAHSEIEAIKAASDMLAKYVLI